MITPETTLRDVWWLHYRPQKLPCASNHTIRKYRQMLNHFDRQLGRPATVADLDLATIEGVQRKLAASGISELSVIYFKKNASVLWYWLVEQKIVTNAPKRRPKGRPRTRPILPPKPIPTPAQVAASYRTRFPERRRLIVPAAAQAPIEKMKSTRPLNDLLTVYISRKLRNANPTTPKKYDMAVDELQFLLDREPLISDLTDDNITNAMFQVIQNGRAPATANDYRKMLLALANFAFKKGILRTAPDVEKLTVPHRIPKAWNQEQLGRLWQACEQQTGFIDCIPAADWWLAIHSVIYDSGERIGATLKLRWEFLDRDAGCLTIRAETRKGRREDILRRLHPDTLALLDKIREPERTLIFPWPFNEATLWVRYRRMLKRAGLPTGRDSAFHRLRKSSASWLQVAGGNPTEHLGHADAATTRVYLDPTIIKQQDASALLVRPGMPLKQVS